MKKILYPTDFSAAAENAFIFALHFADHLGASIITLHAFNRPDVSNISLPESLREVYESIDLDAFENFEDEIPMLRDIASGNGFYHVPMVHVLEEGAPVSAILRTANRNKVDLIVMGATGAGRMEAFFFGTNSGKVMEEAHCPVIIVPEEAEIKGVIDHIAIAVNFTNDDVLLVEACRRFRDEMGCHLHLVHIDTQNENAGDKMKVFAAQWVHDKGISTHVVQGKDINERLEEFIKEKHIDLLAILSQKRTWLEELFHKNRAKELSYRHNVPLLVFQLENLK